MKNLRWIALLAVVASSAVGCQRPWFSRGASCNTCPTGVPDCHTSGAGAMPGGYVPDGGYLPSPQG